MTSQVKLLYKSKLLGCQSWVSETHYEVLMGSIAYAVSNDNSDNDIYSFCIPPRDVVFPHERGIIQGFGRQNQRFDQFQKHHILFNNKNYDITVYNIVRYFQLCLENNPNMIDSLFVPNRCILHITKLGTLVRENRRKFLHKGSFFKFKGYSFSQYKKAHSQTRKSSKRKESVEKYGYDLKFAYHIIRLLDESQQILEDGDIDLERNREELKSIRRGDWSWDGIEHRFKTKEKELEELYQKSKLRDRPDEEFINGLLLSILEEHYGSIDHFYKNQSIDTFILNQIIDILCKNNKFS